MIGTCLLSRKARLKLRKAEIAVHDKQQRLGRVLTMAATDAVDGATVQHRECYSGYLEAIAIQGGETAAGEVKELARTVRRNADKVVLAIGRTRLGHRTLKCVLTIGTRSAQSIMASGHCAAQTGRTRDRTRPMLQKRQKVLAKAPSTHDP